MAWRACAVRVCLAAFCAGYWPIGAVRPWSIAAWNQHRKSSYIQKDCVWLERLLHLHSKDEILRGLEELQLSYSGAELQTWVRSHDLVAVQEADPLFCRALGDVQPLLRGQDDLDGRGVQVESCSALVLGNARLLCREQAVLSRPLFRRRRCSRDHTVALVERPDGQRLVVCSVHLHVPFWDMTCLPFKRYLQPLRRAVEAAAGVEEGRLQTPCLLLGDFNVDPEHFKELLGVSRFWDQFQIVTPGSRTAHASNPAVRGDFALVTKGLWQGRALGPENFEAFERHAERVFQALRRDGRCSKGPGPRFESALRRTLLNSDHRPLHFSGVLEAA
ncbi:unnamed protein product [Effrenium voratum]|nr:unnamed protein product [Effrenium voratum]